MNYQTAQERVFFQWDALFNIISSAAVPGGPLAGVTLVERVCPPEQNVYPSVGVQFYSYKEIPFATRQHQVNGSFDIVIAVSQTFDPSVPDTTNAALTKLRSFVDDGHGNGMGPLLRANFGLGGACNRSQIGEMQYLVVAEQSANVIAYAAYKYETEDFVYLG